jgi:hypothetical protein
VQIGAFAVQPYFSGSLNAEAQTVNDNIMTASDKNLPALRIGHATSLIPLGLF